MMNAYNQREELYVRLQAISNRERYLHLLKRVGLTEAEELLYSTLARYNRQVETLQYECPTEPQDLQILQASCVVLRKAIDAQLDELGWAKE